MAEQASEPQPQKKAGGILKLAIPLVVLFVAAGGGFAVYRFVLAPMLAPSEEHAEEVEPHEDTIPHAPINVDLPENFVNVIMEDKNRPASTLLYAVTFECKNALTAELIEGHKPRFIDMVASLHDSRLRSELDDTQSIKASISREVRQKANALLARIELEGEEEEEAEVTEVFYRSFMVDDKL